MDAVHHDGLDWTFASFELQTKPMHRFDRTLDEIGVFRIIGFQMEVVGSVQPGTIQYWTPHVSRKRVDEESHGYIGAERLAIDDTSLLTTTAPRGSSVLSLGFRS